MGPLLVSFFRFYVVHLFIRSHLFGVASIMSWLTPWKLENKAKQKSNVVERKPDWWPLCAASRLCSLAGCAMCLSRTFPRADGFCMCPACEG